MSETIRQVFNERILNHQIQLFSDKAYLDICRFVYSHLHLNSIAYKLSDQFILLGQQRYILPQAYILHKKQQKNSTKRHEAILNSPEKPFPLAKIEFESDFEPICDSSVSSEERSNRKKIRLKKI